MRERLFRVAPAVFVMLAGTAGAGEIEGPAKAQVGSIVVITAHLEKGSRAKWFLPDGLEAEIQTDRQIAFVPAEVGELEIILVEVTGDDILLTRHDLEIVATYSVVEVAENPFLRPPARAPPPPVASVTMFSTTAFVCAPCERWLREERPKLDKGWDFHLEKDAEGVDRFPAFTIRVGDAERHFEGYLEAGRIREVIGEMSR